MAEVSSFPLSRRVQNMSESATIKMAQLARDLKAKGHDVISLSLGEPDFDTPNHIKEAAKKALDDGYTKYTPVPGLMDLRESIVTKFKRDNDLDFDVNQIVVSNGAKQSIANLCLALLDEGDEVVIFTPYWVSYYEIVRLAGGVPVTVSAGIENDYKVTAKQVEASITEKTKMVLFSSPCNPTGSVYSKEELTEIGNVISKHEGIFIVSDEIYEYINFTGQHASIGAVPSVKDRTITVNGFAKGFAMTGWRLGYIGAPKWIAAACAKIQGQFTSGANAFSQKAAAHALLADMSETDKMREEFLKRRDIVIGLLSEIPGFKVNCPPGAFYIFPDISDYFGKTDGTVTINNSNEFCEYILMKGFVAVVTGSAFGADNCFRFSYAASEPELREAVRRIAEVVSKLK
ncbi:MAG: pyridoxal phosphate-dependent aminotransferase [Saprospiraceae bacterium]|nr:pyridoxal phosphate-dependent aminotransferase [Saprospiraceae bacterium]